MRYLHGVSIPPPITHVPSGALLGSPVTIATIDTMFMALISGAST